MRRPRSKLQVSTFPFLAVLLCAMGALLLLLFLMDRRAKIAARNTAAETFTERKKRSDEEEAARQAEWEKAKDALHQTLLAQQNDLHADAKGLAQNLDATNKKLAVVQTQHLALQEKLNHEAKQIVGLNAHLATQRAGLSDADKKGMKANAELIEAARELAELERAFDQLKALRAREHGKAVYSIVPYHGKRGDPRTPIYVECVRDGVLFHADQKSLEGLDFNADAVRREVERRTGRLAIEKTAKEKSRTPLDEKTGPYVLFLVRPDGIPNYYKAQTALTGYQVDFGYELVDADWVLDFNVAPGAKPGMASTPAKADNRPELPAIPAWTVPREAGRGGVPVAPTGLVARPLQSPLTPFGVDNRSLPGAAPGSGVSGGPPPLGPPGPPKVDTGIPARGQAFVPFNKIPPTVPIVASPSAGVTSGSAGVSGQPSTNPAPFAGQQTKPVAEGAAQSLPPIENPVPGAKVGGKPSGQSGERPSEGGTDGGFAKSPSPFVAVAPGKPAPPPPLSRILGNKDFVITIDCYAEHVMIFPNAGQFRWTEGDAQDTEKAIVEAVTKLIARRQASVRPGEPPYRPVIRFQVAAEGLRSFHRVHPLLAPLRIPMTRENNVEE